MSNRSTHRPAAVAAFGVALLLALVSPAVAGAAPDPATAGDRGGPGAQSRSGAADRHVVAISIDGLGRAGMRALGRSGAPALYRMLDEGSGTLNARTVYERTWTLPNHTGMMTGRRVGGDYGHEVWFNTDNGRTVRAMAGRYVRSVFDVVHDRGGSTALYASKSKFRFLNRSWNEENGRPDRVGVNHGRDKIDRFMYADAEELTDALVRRLETNPRTFSFLHLELPDVAGHEHGWMSTEYLAAVSESDALVGRVLDAVAGDPDLAGSVNVVLTSDHGGKAGSKSHNDVSNAGVFRIPFLTWGVDVRGGRNLYALNPERRNPGKWRKSYKGAQPIRNLDLASLATSLLDMPRVPYAQLARTTPLEVS